MKKNGLEKSPRTNNSARKTILFLSFCIMLSFISFVGAEIPVDDMQIQDENLVISTENTVEIAGDPMVTSEPGTTGDASFYELILDSEEKIGDAYIAIKEASATKDWDKITAAQKTARDQLSFNAYAIKKLDVSENLQNMTENYYQSLQYESALFDAAYMHNIGKGDYATIQSRMEEAETKSDEYYGFFMAELKTVNPAFHDELVAVAQQAKSESF